MDNYFFIMSRPKKEIVPTLLILFGLRFYFYTRVPDPIHIHVKSSDGEAKWEIEEDLRLVYDDGLKAKQVRQ